MWNLKYCGTNKQGQYKLIAEILLVMCTHFTAKGAKLLSQSNIMMCWHHSVNTLYFLGNWSCLFRLGTGARRQEMVTTLIYGHVFIHRWPSTSSMTMIDKSRNTVLMKANIHQIMSTAFAFCLSVADSLNFHRTNWRFCDSCISNYLENRQNDVYRYSLKSY